MKNDSPFSLFSRKRGYFKNDSQERTDFKMKNARDAFGYIIGLVLFIILIPIIMWKASGDFRYLETSRYAPDSRIIKAYMIAGRSSMLSGRREIKTMMLVAGTA